MPFYQALLRLATVKSHAFSTRPTFVTPLASAAARRAESCCLCPLPFRQWPHHLCFADGPVFPCQTIRLPQTLKTAHLTESGSCLGALSTRPDFPWAGLWPRRTLWECSPKMTSSPPWAATCPPIGATSTNRTNEKTTAPCTKARAFSRG